MSKAQADIAHDAIWLRRDAEKVGGALPPLLASAERLAASVAMGGHGRKRAGTGETFWQYRRAMPGDVMTAVDWRRSARSDKLYIREMEWEAAQTVSLWADDALAMDYKSDPSGRSKADRAKLLTLALSVLLVKAGERVALLGTDAAQPRSGETQLRRMAMTLAQEREDRPDYGAPPQERITPGGRAVFFSDFMGPKDEIFDGLARAAEHNVSGVFVQIVDEAEEAFPFDGRVIFESMAGVVQFETQRAKALKEAYLDRLAERRAILQDTARRTGWQCLIHRTSQSPRQALLWLYGAIGGQI